MSVMDRLGQVVKSEWNARFKRDDDKPTKEEIAAAAAALRNQTTPPGPARAPARSPARGPTVSDVDGAMRVLELSGTPTLDAVRARHRELARRYHPKTLSDKSDEAHAAVVVLEALTDALELLEEHLLPLPALSESATSR
ncbi:MAG: hypothetical protein Q8O67_11930 [Deltaproteobacteria bacterium]|nr:hypothetical protein [Deltaproteobacteria bacterium]